MGIISGILGLGSEANIEKVEKQLEVFLLPDERIEKAFKLVRDLSVFTNRRIILIDKQGLTGRKTSYVSIPFKSITKYSIESTGHFDLDAEVKLWLSSHHEPIELEFRKSKDVAEIMKLITERVT